MKDKNGRILILQVTIQGSNYILINIYNANTEQQQLTALNQLDEYLDTIEINRDTQILLGGDLNFIHDLLLDADGGKSSLKLMSIATMQNLTERDNLCDVWRVRNPTNKRFTFRKKNPFLQRRLDYIFISNEFQESVVNIEVLPSVNSDHSLIYLKLTKKTSLSRGRSYWKFNNFFLKEPDYINAMRTGIEKIKNTDLTLIADPRMKWEVLKYRIRQFSRSYSINAAGK